MSLKNYSSFSKKEIIKAFGNLQQKLWLSIIIALVGISYIVYGIYTIIINDYEFIFLFAGIGFITVSIALYVIPIIMANKANKEMIDIDYEMTFYDNYFDVVIKKGTERQESSIDYKDIYRLVRKSNIFYIYLNKNQAILLKLDSFTVEDKTDFLNLMKGIR